MGLSDSKVRRFAGIDRHLFYKFQIEDGGLQLLYGISNLELDDIRYPLERLDYEKQETYYDVVFWLSDDFVCLTSETLEGFENTNLCVRTEFKSREGERCLRSRMPFSIVLP